MTRKKNSVSQLDFRKTAHPGRNRGAKLLLCEGAHYQAASLDPLGRSINWAILPSAALRFDDFRTPEGMRFQSTGTAALRVTQRFPSFSQETVNFLIELSSLTLLSSRVSFYRDHRIALISNSRPLVHFV